MKCSLATRRFIPSGFRRTIIFMLLILIVFYLFVSQQEILTLQINFMTEEFLTVLAHHSLLGELARAKHLLTTPAGNTVSGPVK